MVYHNTVHARTVESSEEAKDALHDTLEQVISETPKQDMQLIIVDHNAKVRKDPVPEPVTGRHILHDTSNDNGSRLIEQATSNNLRIKSTMLEHKQIHKQPWISSDESPRNQIDLVLVDARHNTNVLDVRTCRGAAADSVC